MNFMRRLIAFAMVALLALAMAVAVLGCGAKKEEPAATPPASEAPPMGSMSDSAGMMADTSMAH